jgi:heptosyltransferase-2
MKILVIRFSSIGDIVLTTPVLRCLKEQLSDVKIHYVTKPAFADLVRYNPHVNKVHELKDTLRSTLDELKSENFDVIIDLHNNLRSSRLKRSLRGNKYAVRKENLAKWRMVNMKGISAGSVDHIVTRYLETVHGLGVKSDGKGLELHIPDQHRVRSSDLPASHQKGFVALALGASAYTKRLPEHRLIELCKLLDRPIVLIGGQTDKEIASSVESAAGGKVYDATGKFSILESASLVDLSSSVICHDSGAMHLACALGKPVISVWGNTTPQLGFAPFQPEKPDHIHINEVSGLGCRPCSKLGLDRCPKGHFHCMENQELGRIVQQALSYN